MMYWTPCKVKLPKKPLFSSVKGYIVQDANVIYPYSAYWDGEKWMDVHENELHDIIAWMPLPNPYTLK